MELNSTYVGDIFLTFRKIIFGTFHNILTNRYMIFSQHIYVFFIVM
jgi:hypothetical protein